MRTAVETDDVNDNADADDGGDDDEDLPVVLLCHWVPHE
jgi:hypothetical protein